MGKPRVLSSCYIMPHTTDWVIYLVCRSFSQTSEKISYLILTFIPESVTFIQHSYILITRYIQEVSSMCRLQFTIQGKWKLESIKSCPSMMSRLGSIVKAEGFCYWIIFNYALCIGPGPPKLTHAPWIGVCEQGIDANMGAECMHGLNNPFPAPGVDNVHRQFILGPPSLLLREEAPKKIPINQSSRPLQARAATATFSTLQTLRHVANKTQQMRRAGVRWLTILMFRTAIPTEAQGRQSRFYKV